MDNFKKIDFTSFISKEESLISKQLNNENTIDVVYCIDDNYSMPCGVSILSLLDNNKDINVIIHLFVISLSDSNKAKLIATINQFDNVKFNLYYVNNQFKINDYNQKYFPLSASLRIITPEILKDKCDYMLYLDADTLIVGSIKEILNYKNDKTVSAVLDVLAHNLLVKLNISKLNISNGLYFNSGVLFINNAKWVDLSIASKSLYLLLKNEFDSPDQDVLNILLSDNCNYLHTKFNRHFINRSERIQNKCNGDSLIMHYTSEDKPWFTLFMTPLYYKYVSMSPWKNEKLKLAGSYKQIRDYSKMIRRKNKLKSIKYYFIYLFTKFKEKRNKAH